MPWQSWHEVPDKPPDWVQQYKVFVEIFSGTARVTTKVSEMSGLLVMPPIDIDIGGANTSSTNILDSSVWKKILAWIDAGAVQIAHFGTMQIFQ